MARREEGSGAKEAGPNSPLDGLSAVLKNSVHRWAANPSKLIPSLHMGICTLAMETLPAFELFDKVRRKSPGISQQQLQRGAIASKALTPRPSPVF